MSEAETPRFALPLLTAGQAQKEVTHNEALVLLDALIAARAEAANAITPPATPAPGQCWALGAQPTGAWLGKGGQLAVWTAGGWRFCDVGDGFALRVGSTGARWQRSGTGWSPPPTLGIPSGGAVIDSEARAALAVIRAALTASGHVSAT